MDETTLDLKDIIRVIKKRRKIIIYSFLISIIIAAVVSFIIPPTYEAETNLRIKQPKGLGDSLLADLPIGSAAETKQLMSTYAEILKGRTVVQEVIDKTQSDKEDIPTYEDMLKKITTQPVKDTEILKVKVKAKSPEEAQLLTNTLVDTFNDRMTFLVRSEKKIVREFIEERLQESKKELEKAEIALQEYKQQQKIVAPADETKAMLDSFVNINKLSAENAVTLVADQAKLSSVQQEIDKEKPSFIADSPLIQQYKSKLADLEVNLVSLAQNYTDNHPQVLATRAAINETKVKLNAEIGRVLNADAASMNPIHQGLVQGKIMTEADLSAAEAQKAAIDKIIATGEDKLNKVPAKERGLVKVMRDADVAQQIYVMLANRHEEARINEVMQPTDVQVIDVAIAPDKPVFPKIGLNIIIAAILGLFLGMALAFGLEYMNKTIRNADDVKDYLDLPVLGSIPDFPGNDKSHNISILSKIKQLFKKRDTNSKIKG